jgi:hypothetical protein
MEDFAMAQPEKKKDLKTFDAELARLHLRGE